MARSLNSEEAAVFNEEPLESEQFPLLSDFAEALLKRQKEEMELSPDPGIWWHGRFPGT